MSVTLENAMKPVAKRKEKEEAAGKLTPKRRQTLDEMLDEALDETFPASDALALTAPSKARPDGGRSRETSGQKGNLRRHPVSRS
jgi:hypothetical protein